MSRERELIKNTVILAVGYISTFLAGLVVLPIYTEELSKTEYGIYDLMTIIVSLILPIVSCQIRLAVFRYLIEARKRNDEVEVKRNITNAVCFIIVAAAGFSLAVEVVVHLEMVVKQLLILYYFITIVSDVLKQICRGLGENRNFIIGTIIESVVTIVLAWFLVGVLKWRLEGVLITLDVALLLSVLYFVKASRFYKRIDLGLINLSHLKEMLKYSIPLVPNTISLWVIKASDRFVLTGVLGIETNAIYSVANKIPNYLNQVFTVYNNAWTENASMFVDDKDADKYISKIFEKTIKYLNIMTACMIAVMPVLFELLIDKQYAMAYEQMAFLLFGIYFSCVTTFLGSIFGAYKKTTFIGITSMVGAIVNLVINLMLVKQIGMYAASISTIICYLLLVVLRIVKLKKICGLSINYKKWSISVAFLILLSTMFQTKNVTLCVVNCVAAIVYGAIMCREELKEIVNKIIKKRV